MPFSRFSRTDLPTLADKIAAFSDNVSFAECVKVGNRLKITLVSAKTTENAVAYDKKELRSDVGGEIEFIKVYRGTALKSAGDKVEAGEPVCAGYAVVKGKTVEVGVIAVVSVKSEYIYVYTSGSDNESDIAEIFARASFGGDVISVTAAPPVYNGENYEYTVRIIYRRLFYG